MRDLLIREIEHVEEDKKIKQPQKSDTVSGEAVGEKGTREDEVVGDETGMIQFTEEKLNSIKEKLKTEDGKSDASLVLDFEKIKNLPGVPEHTQLAFEMLSGIEIDGNELLPDFSDSTDINKINLLNALLSKLPPNSY